MEAILPLLTSLGLLITIVWACTIFTNAIEWMGHRFKLSDGAVGSVLAAVGTALPETMVPIIALVSGAFGLGNLGHESSQEIGIGAILGAPFLLSTLAMGVMAIATLIFAAKRGRSYTLKLDMFLFRRDLLYFLPAYTVVFLAAFIEVPWVKWVIAGLLLVYYGVYVARTMAKEHIPDATFHIDPLFMAPKATEPPTWLIWVQTVIGLLLIMVAAHFFVEDIQTLSALWSINPMVLSLLMVPIATEMPEKFNSVIWLGKHKDTLAMGNVTGAMVFQSCIPTAIGVAFTPWVLNTQGMLSVGLCFTSVVLLLTVSYLKKAITPAVLGICGAFYLVFLAYTFSIVENPALAGGG